MNDQGILNNFADDLEGFFVGATDAETIREKYWRPGVPTQIAKVMPYVEHLLADADIREADGSYKEMQQESLEVLVACLRRGIPARDFPVITFLSRPRRKGVLCKLLERLFGA